MAIQGTIVVFGHSLDECDAHIFADRIGRHGKTSRLYVSLFGEPDAVSNQNIIRRASEIAGLRNDRKPLEVKFFDAGSVSMWR